MNYNWLIIFFLIPAYVANMMPVIFMRSDFLADAKLPVDAGKRLFGRRLFGKSKTWRGILLGAIGGSVTSLALLLLLIFLGASNYGRSWQDLMLYLFSGAIIGFGAMIGDLLKSFFKRRVGIDSGKPWPIFDQIDFVIGAWFFWLPFLYLTNIKEAQTLPIIEFIGISILVTLPIHFFSNVLAYKVGLKKVWW